MGNIIIALVKCVKNVIVSAISPTHPKMHHLKCVKDKTTNSWQCLPGFIIYEFRYVYASSEVRITGNISTKVKLTSRRVNVLGYRQP